MFCVFGGGREFICKHLHGNCFVFATHATLTPMQPSVALSSLTVVIFRTFRWQRRRRLISFAIRCRQRPHTFSLICTGISPVLISKGEKMNHIIVILLTKLLCMRPAQIVSVIFNFSFSFSVRINRDRGSCASATIQAKYTIRKCNLFSLTNIGWLRQQQRRRPSCVIRSIPFIH